MKAKIAMVHIDPVEMVPLSMNLIRCIQDGGVFRFMLHTTADCGGRALFLKSGVDKSNNPNPTGRWWALALILKLWFHVMTFLRLLWQRPDAIVSVGAGSTSSVYLFSLVRPCVPLFIHSLECQDQDSSMLRGNGIGRWFHGVKTARLLERACWVSQDGCPHPGLSDCGFQRVPEAARKFLPDYPPMSWWKHSSRAWEQAEGPFRFIHVGRLSLRDSFLEEFVDWLKTMPRGSVFLDIRGGEMDEETRGFLVSNQSEALRFMAGDVEYDDLPVLFGGYHAGLILAREELHAGVESCESRLFVYQACGLDVWYSRCLDGIGSHQRSQVRPRVIGVDFHDLDPKDTRAFMNRPSALPIETATRYAEGPCTLLESAIWEAVKTR